MQACEVVPGQITALQARRILAEVDSLSKFGGV